MLVKCSAKAYRMHGGRGCENKLCGRTTAHQAGARRVFVRGEHQRARRTGQRRAFWRIIPTKWQAGCQTTEWSSSMSSYKEQNLKSRRKSWKSPTWSYSPHKFTGDSILMETEIFSIMKLCYLDSASTTFLWPCKAFCCHKNNHLSRP